MSLDWRMTGPYDPENNPLHSDGMTETMVFATMSVGLTDLTEKNLEEWIWRIEFLRMIGHNLGTRAVRDENGKASFEDYYPSPAELKAWIGLRTNAGTDTRKQWMKTVMLTLEHKANRSAYDLIQKMKEAA